MNITLDNMDYTKIEINGLTRDKIDSLTNKDFTFEDFVLYTFVIIDDIYNEISHFLTRPGPNPIVSDSEIIAMAIVGECLGWDQETELISNWHHHLDLFPNIPSRSRFNRRRRNLMFAINIIRRIVLQTLDVAQSNLMVIDSLPLPVMNFHLVPGSSNNWDAHGARFGKVPSKKETIYGYKLHMLITIDGVIIDFELASANLTDLQVGGELLENHTDFSVFGDKGYISAEVVKRLAEQNRIRLITLPRSNQKEQLNKDTRRFINSTRQMIETVNGQLTEQFNIERTYAHSFWGLSARLYTKLAAHTICIYINRMLGRCDFLKIKRLAFPNSN